MRVLALDLSMSRTGWAIRLTPGSTQITTGSIELPNARDEAERFCGMLSALRALIDTQRPSAVIFGEFMHSPNALAARANLGLRALLFIACRDAGLDCAGVSEPRARKSAGVDLTMKPWPEEEADLARRLEKWERYGKKAGNKKPTMKRDMKLRVERALGKLGVHIESHDEADAVVLLLGT